MTRRTAAALVGVLLAGLVACQRPADLMLVPQTEPLPVRSAQNPPPPVARGTLSLTPDVVRIGRREPWALSATLTDTAGTPVRDGTLVTLTGRGPGGAELVAARVTVNGEARWTLLPDTAGAWTLDVHAGMWHAQTRGVARSALLGGVPPLLWAGDRLRIGPLTWDDGALPDDGTPVEIAALDARGGGLWSTRGFTVQGRVDMDTPPLRGARTLRLAVAGAVVTLPWTQP